MEINSFNDYENDDYFLQVRPSKYYDTNSLIRKMINQGSLISEDTIKTVFSELTETVKLILKEGGMVSIDDFISFSPSIINKSNNKNLNKIDKNKLTLCVKVSVPASFCESIAMENKINDIAVYYNKNKLNK